MKKIPILLFPVAIVIMLFECHDKPTSIEESIDVKDNILEEWEENKKHY